MEENCYKIIINFVMLIYCLYLFSIRHWIVENSFKYFFLNFFIKYDELLILYIYFIFKFIN